MDKNQELEKVGQRHMKDSGDSSSGLAAGSLCFIDSESQKLKSSSLIDPLMETDSRPFGDLVGPPGCIRLLHLLPPLYTLLPSI